MIEPYTAVALQTPHHNCQTQEDWDKNLDVICEAMDAAIWLAALQYPVKLVALGEAAIQTFADSKLGFDHATAANEWFNEFPGPELDRLRKKAQEHQTFIVGQCRARDSKLHPDRYFNLAFILDPKGEVIHRYHKNQVYRNEHSTTPHDIWDSFTARYGCDCNAFFPVTDTEIGKIGTIICMDRSYPETARGLAMNGAEVIYMPSYPEPWCGNGWYEIQNRSRALDNTCYVVAPNSGPWFLNADSKLPMDVFGGKTQIVDYQGQIIGEHQAGDYSFVSAIVDVEALRYYRANAYFGNWLKDLRVEVYRSIYEEPIYPKNLWMDQPPQSRPVRDKYLHDSIRRLQERGVYTAPSNRQGRSDLGADVPGGSQKSRATEKPKN
ncbi:MAG: nitrilase-related carbon-nitrogen hydrolase [Acidobacteriota bacterium]|nr:nitrilase-related carbon-nitrogen hydrolase [Acidobacteriota bacterium]